MPRYQDVSQWFPKCSKKVRLVHKDHGILLRETRETDSVGGHWETRLWWNPTSHVWTLTCYDICVATDASCTRTREVFTYYRYGKARHHYHLLTSDKLLKFILDVTATRIDVKTVVDSMNKANAREAAAVIWRNQNHIKIGDLVLEYHHLETHVSITYVVTYHTLNHLFTGDPTTMHYISLVRDGRLWGLHGVMESFLTDPSASGIRNIGNLVLQFDKNTGNVSLVGLRHAIESH
jgi:hypothetical protein